jgi:DNA topoisomerase VI subunit B
MPPIAATVLPHAKSLNNITISHLLREFSASSGRSMDKFLTSAIAGLLPRTASAITTALGIRSIAPDKLGASQVAALCQVLRDDPSIRPPAPQCLSPAGEYNLRLGVLKELKPRLVATYTDKPGVHEGHAFLVEAAVSLGGSNIREGINIFRFANRSVSQ